MSSAAKSRAIALAARSTHSQWHLGAVLWRGGSVLAAGANTVRNHPSIVDNAHLTDCSVHAEAAALKRAGNPKGATLYVARVTRQGRLGLAKPCGHCEEAIRAAGVRRVCFTTGTGAWDSYRV